MRIRRRLRVGDPRAVQILAEKILGKRREDIRVRRVLRAASKAQVMHARVSGQRHVGFYHGLLTGYAVALKILYLRM